MKKKSFAYQFYHTTEEAWDAMYQALLTATKSIYWEVYVFIDDSVGERFITALSDKARAGIEVKLVVDAIGSFGLSRVGIERLRSAGVEVLIYNRLYPGIKIYSWVSRIFRRNHRKVLIIDEEIVFLGGVNIDAHFHNWDDVYLKIMGKVARPLLRAFAKSYISAGGDKKRVRHLLHPKLLHEYPEWKKKLTFISQTSSFQSRSKAQQVYLKALETAKESVDLLSPYYVPNREFLKALEQARRRGVKVRIFLPLRLDHKIMEWIARAYYALTEEAGAKIHFLPKMHHGKAMIVDNKMGFVGSHNLTRRSSYFDAESGVLFDDKEMAEELTALFNTWKKDAQPFDKQRWQKRGMLDRVKEWWAKRIEDYL